MPMRILLPCLLAVGLGLSLAVANHFTGVEGVGVVGTVASLAGLVLTAYVALAVRELRRAYVRQAVFKECHERLSAHRKNLASAVTKKDMRQIRRQLAGVKAVLERVALHDPTEERVQWSVPAMEAAARSAGSSAVARASDVLVAVDERVVKLELRLVEMEWGNQDG